MILLWLTAKDREMKTKKETARVMKILQVLLTCKPSLCASAQSRMMTFKKLASPHTCMLSIARSISRLDWCVVAIVQRHRSLDTTRTSRQTAVPPHPKTNTVSASSRYQSRGVSRGNSFFAGFSHAAAPPVLRLLSLPSCQWSFQTEWISLSLHRNGTLSD